MSSGNEPNRGKKSDDDFNRDWRDPSKPRNPEDDVVVRGWRRRADGTFERVDQDDSEDKGEE